MAVVVQTVTPIQVCVASPRHPCSPGAPPPIYVASAAAQNVVQIGRIVQFCVAAANAAVTPPPSSLPHPVHHELVPIAVVGPIVGVRKVMKEGTEYLVRNIYVHAQIKDAILRVPRARGSPADAEFARELRIRLRRIAELAMSAVAEAEEIGPEKPESLDVAESAEGERDLVPRDARVGRP
ncbi:hypothetical protein C2E23DRAFT_890675 [Lenzites betulinus]|nr:hypothetical protein C2E23DRAFT_890675 [Lenzites betulinus]